mgnify:FL=1
MGTLSCLSCPAHTLRVHRSLCFLPAKKSNECLKRMEVKGAKCKKRIYFHSDCILQARSKVSTYHVQSGQVKR